MKVIITGHMALGGCRQLRPGELGSRVMSAPPLHFPRLHNVEVLTLQDLRMQLFLFRDTAVP